MSNREVKAYIGLGSNIGNREDNLNHAIHILKSNEKIEVTDISSYYNTAPVGYVEQPDFLNAVAAIKTTLSPHELLHVCQDIEKELRRERMIRWGPRTIDLDILLYGDTILNDECLIIPHPRMHEREFVLKPLNEVGPYAFHPILKKTIKEVYDTLKKQHGVLVIRCLRQKYWDFLLKNIMFYRRNDDYTLEDILYQVINIYFKH